jgi:hypothetical protein
MDFNAEYAETQRKPEKLLVEIFEFSIVVLLLNE